MFKIWVIKIVAVHMTMIKTTTKKTMLQLQIMKWLELTGFLQIQIQLQMDLKMNHLMLKLCIGISIHKNKWNFIQIMMIIYHTLIFCID